MKTGVIFSIEEFAIHDGPGIRTTLFLKGCPLRCTWCHNPEGISPKPQYIEKKNKRDICGYEISSDKLAEQILKNKDIYTLHNGGVTFTGGEPLFQTDFVIDVVQKIKPDIHVAIETSGYATDDIFKSVIPMFNLVLLDIKHTDPVIHKEYTGVDNKQILENLKFLCLSHIDFIIRIPLIPGVNDTKKNMLNILSLIKGAQSLQRVEILPYHKTAGAKYAMIGKKYSPLFDTEKKPHIYNVFEENNIETVIL
jgi:pyruvate formate lyase activating enzyme